MTTTTCKRDRSQQVTGPRFLAARAMERAAMRGALAKTSSSLTSLSGAMKSMSSDGRKKVERSICAWNLPDSLDWTFGLNMIKRCEMVQRLNIWIWIVCNSESQAEANDVSNVGLWISPIKSCGLISVCHSGTQKPSSSWVRLLCLGRLCSFKEPQITYNKHQQHVVDKKVGMINPSEERAAKLCLSMTLQHKPVTSQSSSPLLSISKS